MKYFVFILALSFLQEIPLKPKEEFEIKLDYSFRQRPVADHNTLRLGEPQNTHGQKTSAGVLPYLVLNIKILALPEDKMRMRITTNLQEKAAIKKVSVGSDVELDLGFTTDMIDRVTPHEYVLAFISEDKSVVDRIVISVGDDGTFVVNGEQRGKF